jgi:Skp family chaperone for outer membrane proteins
MLKTRSLSSWAQVLLMMVSICLGGAAWRALSEERPAADAPHRIPVALLDVAKVFKQARDFNAQMNRMKIEIETFDRTIRGRQAELEKLRPKGSGSAPSSGEATEKAAKMAADLQAEVAAKRQSFLVEEARVYADTYKTIQDVVDQICQARDVGVLLRFSSDPIDPADRSSVLQGVNRPVVYSAVPDLTADVIAALNGDKL